MKLLVQAIKNRYGDLGESWLKELPHLIFHLSQKLELSDLNPFPNLSYNYVLSGFQKGRPIVLKVGLDINGLKQETFALRFFRELGAVRVLYDEEGVLLLERALPGVTIQKASELDAIGICCQVMKRLHKSQSVVPAEFPHIKEWLSILDKEWEIPFDYLLKARNLRDKLLQTTENELLLHGDLHHENILKKEKEWCIIDPKGVIGDPYFETWAFIKNIKTDSEFVSTFFNFNLQRIHDWYFVRSMLAVCWNLEDNLNPDLFLDLAHQTYSLTSC